MALEMFADVSVAWHELERADQLAPCLQLLTHVATVSGDRPLPPRTTKSKRGVKRQRGRDSHVEFTLTRCPIVLKKRRVCTVPYKKRIETRQAFACVPDTSSKATQEPKAQHPASAGRPAVTVSMATPALFRSFVIKPKPAVVAVVPTVAPPITLGRSGLGSLLVPHGGATASSSPSSGCGSGSDSDSSPHSDAGL